MSRFVASSAKLAVLTSVAAVLVAQPAAATITHVYDRGTVYSSINMCRPLSSGESLADIVPAQPEINCLPESPGGDINVAFTWADGVVLSGIWSPNASGNLPGVSVTDGSHAALITETGDTFDQPWTLANGSTSNIVNVVLSALGAPDMGFDTDTGTDPYHAAGGFPLYLDASSVWNGDLTVTYDRYTNWDGTTDMFHRMTLAFGAQTPLIQGSNMVFVQDTDEIPLPASPALVMLGVAMLASARRRQAKK